MKTCRTAILLFTVAIVLWGCPYKSDVGIDAGPSIKIDKALLGVWHKPGYPADSTELLFTKATAQQYKLTAVIKSDDAYETHFYNAWFSPLGKWQLITLYDTESKKYSFGEVNITDKELSLQLLSEDISSEQFATVPAMRKFMEEVYTGNKMQYDKDVDFTGLLKVK